MNCAAITCLDSVEVQTGESPTLTASWHKNGLFVSYNSWRLMLRNYNFRANSLFNSKDLVYTVTPAFIILFLHLLNRCFCEMSAYRCFSFWKQSPVGLFFI